MTEDVLPSNDEAGELTLAEVEDHFGVYYDLYGFHPDEQRHLPRNPRILTDVATSMGHVTRAAP